MNKIFITGNVTSLPKTRIVNTKNGQRKVAEVSIANNEGYGENKTTTFFKASFWDARADFVEKYIVTGTKVAVTGSLSMQSREYQGKTYTDLVINFPDIEICQSKAETKPQETNYDKPASEKSEFTEIEDNDELPF